MQAREKLSLRAAHRCMRRAFARTLVTSQVMHLGQANPRGGHDDLPYGTLQLTRLRVPRRRGEEDLLSLE